MQICYKPVVLGTLGMPGYAHLNWYYQFEEIIYVYLQGKISISCFYGDTAKICKLILGTLGMSGDIELK